MATRVLYLIRHGYHERENPHQDDLGGGLTSIGVEQAKLAAQRFSKLPITAIHSSTKRRAAETADIIAQKGTVVAFGKCRREIDRGGGLAATAFLICYGYCSHALTLK